MAKRKPNRDLPLKPPASSSQADMGTSMLGLPGPAPRRKTGGKPKTGESSGPQNVASGMPFWSGGFLANAFGMAGGGALGPGGFGNGWGGLFPGGYPGISLAFGGALYGFGSNGFVQPRKGSYATYRLMSLHPTLRLVRALINGPIMSSQWTVKPSDWASEQQKTATGKKKKAPSLSLRAKLDPNKLDVAVELVKEQLLPLRNSILSEALRYLEFGWRPFEKVWDVRRNGPGGRPLYWLKKLKPLLPDLTTILHDGRGNYTGLTQLSQEDSFDPGKTWLCTYDGEAGNLYGFSRHEAAYDPWVDWQSSRIRRWLTGNKLAGYMPILYYRPGKTLINGVETDNFAIAKQMLAAAQMGNGAIMPTTEYEDEELQQTPELAKISPWKLEIVDCGSYAPAIAGMIEESEYDDRLLVRAWCWPERAVLEAHRSGSRADSQQHTDSASLDRELIDDDIANQLTCGQPQSDVPGVVDDIVGLNLGDDYRGAVTLAPMPLVDQKVEVYSKILESALANPNIAPLILAKINDDQLLDYLDIDRSEDPDARLQKILDTAQHNKGLPGDELDAANKNPQPQPNGNGKSNKNGKAKAKRQPQAARVLSRWIDDILP